MIDIHCHILPGIDDGPPTAAEAMKMARLAVKDGVRTIVATPHCFDGVYDCQHLDIVARCEEFNTMLVQESIALTVLPGAEVRFSPELSKAVEQGQVLRFGDSCDFMLLELPALFIPDAVVMTIRSLQQIGVATILAHPERNRMLLQKPGILSRFIRAGAEIQLTADSLLGDFGMEAQKIACQLLQLSVRCYLGSDGHSFKKRKPVLTKAVRVAAKEIGEERAAKLVSIR